MKVLYRLFGYCILSGMLFFSGCHERVSQENLHYLGGYWEIRKVSFPNGGIKEYKINTTIDYIHIEQKKGWRKKVQPQIAGTYITSDDAENFIIEYTDDVYHIKYASQISKWEEALVALDKDSFSVVNKDGTRYDYERYEPIEL